MPTAAPAAVAEAPIADADRPIPPKPTKHVVAAGAKPEPRAGRRAAGRDAAVKAMGASTAAAPAASAAVRSIVAEIAGEGEGEGERGGAVDAPLAGEVLDSAAAEEVSPERAKVLAARKAAKGRVAAFEAAKAARAESHRRAQETQRQGAEMQAREAALKAQAADLELAKSDPFRYLEKSGKSPQQLVEEAIKAGDPQAAITRELEELKAWRKGQEEQVAKWQKDQQQAQLVQKAEAFERRFADLQKEKPAEFATVRRYDPDYITQRCRILSQQVIRETGQWPGDYEGAPVTQEQILRHVQDLILQRESETAPTEKGASREGPKPPATITATMSPRTPTKARYRTRDERKELGRQMLRAGRRH